VCVLLPAALASASEVRVPVPGATSIEAPALTRVGNWEAAVSFDPVLCEVSCVYRLRGDRFGRTPAADLLLPPAVDIQVRFGETSTTVTIDPARTRLPQLARVATGRESASALPAAHGTRAPALRVSAMAQATATPPHPSPSFVRPTPLALRV
jgi:hypothetical protein